MLLLVAFDPFTSTITIILPLFSLFFTFSLLAGVFFMEVSTYFHVLHNTSIGVNPPGLRIVDSCCHKNNIIK